VFWTKGTFGLFLPRAYWLLVPLARATEAQGQCSCTILVILHPLVSYGRSVSAFSAFVLPPPSIQ